MERRKTGRIHHEIDLQKTVYRRMIIGGVHPFSLNDYPGKVAATIFTQGCPLRCHFCHNPSLLAQKSKATLSPKELLSMLKERQKMLDGVVITGGEPTIHRDLPNFIQKLKEFSLLVKLDTSGINPKVLALLLEQKLLDYIAMDIKAPLEKYSELLGGSVDTKAILESIKIIMQSTVDYEFRSTIIDGFHTKEDILQMGSLIKGAKLYILQSFVPKNALTPAFRKKSAFSKAILQELQKKLENYVQKCHIRANY